MFEGSKAEGTPLQTVQAKVTSGKWGPVNVASALKSGEYTAIATEPSSLGNQPGKSSPDTFIVDTSSPKVVLTAPTSPSNDRTPSFTGTASANTEVVVHIYEGTKAEGTEVSKATATGTGAAWTSGQAGTALATGKHTFAAVATQESPLGNPEGKSNVVTFVVNTNPPTVTLNTIETPSKDTTPSFSGTASETQAVTIKIYQGAEAKGTPFATAEAPVGAEKWGPVSSTTTLPEGEYTAVASEPSSLGNAEGKSAAIKFTVVTKSPVVTLNEVESPSKNTTPAFSGTSERHSHRHSQDLQRDESRRNGPGNARSDAEKRHLGDGGREKRARGWRLRRSRDPAEFPREPRGDEQHRHVRRGHEPTSGHP